MNVEEVVKGAVETLAKVNPEINRLERALEETETAIRNYKYALEKRFKFERYHRQVERARCKQESLYLFISGIKEKGEHC